MLFSGSGKESFRDWWHLPDLENRPEDFFEGCVRDRKLRCGGGTVILNLSNLAGQNNKQLHE